MTFGNSTCVDASAGVVCYGVFFNYRGNSTQHPGVSCESQANFDADITGIGVVISFCASTIITTIASLAATILDNVAARRNAILPSRWQPKTISDSLRGRCTFLRRILERLILNLADQQLVTGFALLVSAWVKLHDNPVLRGYWQEYYRALYPHFPNVWLPNAQFSLVIFLSMASSSSHLAAVLVLREYMEDHRSQARLRLLLIVLFAMFLAVTIALASSFSWYFFSIVDTIFKSALSPKTVRTNSLARNAILAITMAIPIMVTLGVCWVCTLQMTPTLKKRIQDKVRSLILKRLRKWFRLSKLWHSCLMRVLPTTWRAPFTKFAKHCFWFMIIGNEFMVFIIQNILAILSLIWIALQRLATPPTYLRNQSTNAALPPLCSLHNVSPGNQWASFGQLLPMILLFLPVLSAYGAYIEERDKERVTGYAAVPGWDWSPSIPQRKKSSQRPTNQEESELSLLDSQNRRHRSSGSVSNSFGRAHYGRHESSGSLTSPGIGPYAYGNASSPIPVQTAFSPEALNSRGQGGYFGLPTGVSSGVDGQQYPVGPGSRW